MRWNPFVPVLCCVVLIALAFGGAAGSVAQTDTLQDSGDEQAPPPHAGTEQVPPPHAEGDDTDGDTVTDSDGETAEAVDETVNETTDTAADAIDDTTDTTDGAVDDTTDSVDENVDDTADVVEDTGTDSTDAVDGTVDETTDATDETGGGAGGPVDDTTDAVDETTGTSTDATAAVVDETTDATTEGVDETTDAADASAGETADTTTEAVGETTDAVDATADGTTDTTDQVVDETTDAVDDAVDSTTDTVDDATATTTDEGNELAGAATVDGAVDHGSVDDGASGTTESELAALASIAEATAGVTGTTLTAGENESLLVVDGPAWSDGEAADGESGVDSESGDGESGAVPGTSGPGASAAGDGGNGTTGTTAAGTNATDGEPDPAARNDTPADGDGGGNSTEGAGAHRQHEDVEEEIPDGLLDGRSSDGVDGSGAAVAGIALITLLSAGLLNRSSEAAITMGASGPTSLWVQVRTLWATLKARLARLPELLPIPGYERWDDTDPLEHETRRRLYEEITDQQVVNVATLVERTDLSRSTARHHLRILEHEGLVQSTRMQGKRCFYDDERVDLAPLAALTDETRTDLLRELRRCDGASGTELADRLDLDPSTVSYHLERLAEAGLVERERDGRSITNRLTEQARDAVADVVPAPEGRDADPSDG